MDNDVNCKCVTWCRTWEVETHGFKYPITKHHHNCPAFLQEEFAVVELDGTKCVMELNECESMSAESDEDYTFNTVKLTRDQYERLNEFTGF